jgi:AraC-like DNA-binding protein
MRKFTKFDEPVLPTTLAAQLVKLLQAKGVPESDALAGSGVRPGMLGSASARLSLLQQAILAYNGLRLSGDPALGLEFGRHIHINGIGVLGLAVMSSRDLADANARLMRYYTLIASDLRFEYVVEKDVVRLSVFDALPLGDLRPFAHEVSIACMYELAHFVVGRPLPYREMAFSYPEPAHGARYREVFRCPVRFRASVTQMVMDEEALHWPLKYASEPTAQYADEQCRALMATRAADNVAREVIVRLEASLVEPPTLARLARELQTSERSLRRALADSGATYRGLLDEARKNKAIELLTVTRLPVDSIGERLGFANARSFRRAFQRWTGQAPAAFRRRASGASSVKPPPGV